MSNNNPNPPIEDKPIKNWKDVIIKLVIPIAIMIFLVSWLTPIAIEQVMNCGESCPTEWSNFIIGVNINE